MSLARKYSRTLKKELKHYAAWSPVSDPYEVGDYGVFRRGVFQKLGNIREFGVDPGARPGGAEVKFDYTSSGAVVVKTTAEGKVEVFPEQDIEAKLAITFSGETSFYIRTGQLSVTEMASVNTVAGQLKGKRDGNGRRWRLKWRIVRKVYTAKDPAILASAESEASFTLSGKADALKRLEVGNASGEISVTSTKADAVKISGGTGPVALDLFKVRVSGRAGLETVGAEEVEPDELQDDHDVEADEDDGWDEDIDDGDDVFGPGE